MQRYKPAASTGRKYFDILDNDKIAQNDRLKALNIVKLLRDWV